LEELLQGFVFGLEIADWVGGAVHGWLAGPAAGLRRVRSRALYHSRRKLMPPSQNIPSWRRAASDIMDGFQDGSHTSSTSAEVTPGTFSTLVFTSPGREPATGQPGEVRVILTWTWPPSWTSTS